MIYLNWPCKELESPCTAANYKIHYQNKTSKDNFRKISQSLDIILSKIPEELNSHNCLIIEFKTPSRLIQSELICALSNENMKDISNIFVTAYDNSVAQSNSLKEFLTATDKIDEFKVGIINLISF